MVLPFGPLQAIDIRRWKAEKIERFKTQDTSNAALNSKLLLRPETQLLSYCSPARFRL
jgi:hypothetical protein